MTFILSRSAALKHVADPLWVALVTCKLRVFFFVFSAVFVLYYVVKIFLVVANCLAVTIINWKLSYATGSSVMKLLSQSVSQSVCLCVCFTCMFIKLENRYTCT